MASTSAKASNTLFVRNLSKETTRDELSQLFADVGPVRHAIVVHERKGGPSKGFGFVTFAVDADAEDALKRKFELKGKTLKLDWAEDTKKIVPGEQKSGSEPQAKVKEQVEDSTVGDKIQDAEVQNSGRSKVVDWKKRKDEQRKLLQESEQDRPRTVVLFGLAEDFTENQLRKRLKKHGGGLIRSIQREENGMVRVAYDDEKSVKAAVKEISGREWGGTTIYARRMAQVAITTAAKQKCRLICRNLGFHVKDKEFRESFSAFGPIEEAIIRKGDDGKSKGFGFVQFFCRADAQKAITEMNGSKSLGPKGGKSAGPIAVDFALTKDHYEALKNRQEDLAPAEVTQKVEEEDESSTEEEEKEEEEENKDGENDDDDDDDEAESSSSNESEDGSNDESEEDEKASEEIIDNTKATAAQGGDKGVREGRTLFVRNLLFETTDQVIRERFAEFGAVRGVKLVRDAGGRSRGLGFVEFWDKSSCDKVLDAGEIALEGRTIYVNRAVDKDSAQKLKRPEDEEAAEAAAKAKKGKDKVDKRHLYLANEGRVAVENVPSADKKKRQGLEDEKRTKLKNPLFFVSPTRISIKNLNRKPGETIESTDLKRLFKEAGIRGMKERLVKNDEGDRSLFPQGKMPPVKVLKATVFHDSADDPKAKSSGFAFVEMGSHIHALAALRVLNNNPEYAWAASGGKQAMKLAPEARPRLIVSFAIENAAKVRVKKLRVEKFKSGGGSSKAKPQGEKGGQMDSEEQEQRKPRSSDSQQQGARKRAKSDASDFSDNAAHSKVKKQKPFEKKQRPTIESSPAKRKPRRTEHDHDISNKKFEQLVRKRPLVSDKLDEIVAKRANLFDVPEQPKKRWYDE